MVSHTLKRLAAVSVAAALALSLAACGKGGSSSSDSTDANGTATLKLWTHNAGNETELGAINQIVADYNASQTKYKVEVQAFPQDSYNQSVTAAAASKTLPCILDIDGPNVPNWAWGGYLAPLDGLDDTLSKFLPSTVGTYNDKNYSAGFYDVALAMYARKSVLEKNDIRIPTIDQPWTADEFNAALATLKATGEWTSTRWTWRPANTGEWWPYAYSPLLQSFGGDLINRTRLQVRRRRAERAGGAGLGDVVPVHWSPTGTCRRSPGRTPAPTSSTARARSSGTAPGAPRRPATELGDDVLFLPPPDFGNGPKIGGGSWQWAAQRRL